MNFLFAAHQAFLDKAINRFVEGDFNSFEVPALNMFTTKH